MTSVASRESVCTRINERLVESVGQRKYRMWFDRSARLDYQHEPPCLKVAVPNQFIADWIVRNFRGALRDAVACEVGTHADLSVLVDPTHFRTQSSTNTAETVHRDALGGAAKTRTPPSQILRHSLEDFVVGPSNELAHAASIRLAEDGADVAANPLFIHGGCGLGKTHLLQGICKRMLQRRPDTRALYTTAEQFTNEFLASVQTNSIERFRCRIRQLGLLAIDDVHFLANKQGTQKEFLHSFDAIHLSGARVILASDNHPKLIQKFSEQLVSRCVRGMVVEVRPPDTETRARIVRVLAAARGLCLEDSVSDALVHHCPGSIREIEGVLTKLHALANLDQQHGRGQSGDAKIGHVMFNKLLSTEIHVPRKAVRFETIMKVVCEQLRVTRAQVLGSSRQRDVVLARSLVIHLARRLTGMSLPEIAAGLGRNRHSTVVSALRRVAKQLSDVVEVTMPGTLDSLPLAELTERLCGEIRRA